jgi:hypothetical protein
MKKTIVVMLIFLFFLPSISLGDECIEGDCINGSGTMVFSTGHKYTGGFKNGNRHGKGVMLMPGDRKIVGVWEDNEITEGVFTQPDGTVYDGQWRFRERNGMGTLTFPDGRKYSGEFKSGQRHGRGTMIYPDGRKYVGSFEYGARTGQGTMTYPDGHSYTGGFKDGEKAGHGMMVYPDGRTLEGEFKNGEFIKN